MIRTEPSLATVATNLVGSSHNHPKVPNRLRRSRLPKSPARLNSNERKSETWVRCSPDWLSAVSSWTIRAENEPTVVPTSARKPEKIVCHPAALTPAGLRLVWAPDQSSVALETLFTRQVK